MPWSTKEKAFSVEAYFAGNSYRVVQAIFRRKFQCRHAPSNSIIFDWIQRFRDYRTVLYLYSNCLRNTYSGWTVSAIIGVGAGKFWGCEGFLPKLPRKKTPNKMTSKKND